MAHALWEGLAAGGCADLTSKGMVQPGKKVGEAGGREVQFDFEGWCD